MPARSQRCLQKPDAANSAILSEMSQVPPPGFAAMGGGKPVCAFVALKWQLPDLSCHTSVFLPVTEFSCSVHLLFMEKFLPSNPQGCRELRMCAVPQDFCCYRACWGCFSERVRGGGLFSAR